MNAVSWLAIATGIMMFVFAGTMFSNLMDFAKGKIGEPSAELKSNPTRAALAGWIVLALLALAGWLLIGYGLNLIPR